MITVKINEQEVELEGFKLAELPERFIDWQIQSRKELFSKLLRREPVHFLASHLPVLATLTPEGTINLANKGVGLLPREEHLQHYIELFSRVLAESQDRPWEETLPGRVEAASELLHHPEHIDLYRLGSLEIFEGQTFKNIQKNPRVALLFTGAGPQYLSFQLDGVAEILGPGHPVYEFLRMSRLLFEYEHFHIAQPRYPYAYQFWVFEIKEKTPRRRPT